jgi:hypothetical protein
MLIFLFPTVDYSYADPRSDDDKFTAKLSVAAVSPNPENKSLEELANSIDICYTAAPDGWEMKFCSGDDVTEVVSWADDPRLRGFEEAFVRFFLLPFFPSSSTLLILCALNSSSREESSTERASEPGDGVSRWSGRRITPKTPFFLCPFSPSLSDRAVQSFFCLTFWLLQLL